MKRQKAKKLLSQQRHSSIKLTLDNWKDTVLNSEIHLNYTNQTYDVLFMVEGTDNASHAAAKFYYGSKMDPLNAVKPVAYEDIIQNIREFSETPLPGHRTIDKLYNLAAMEAITYLDDDKLLPTSLMVTLIKLQMMFLVDQDAIKVYERITYEKDLQALLKTLLEGEKKTTKAKFDPCDAKSVYIFKSSSTLKPGSRNRVTLNNVEVPAKHMFFVIIGFYDYGILEELIPLNVTLTAVVELVEPEAKHVCGDTCNRADCNYAVEKNCVSLKEIVLMNFWNTFYTCFDAEDYPECFENVFHMAVQPAAETLQSRDMDDNICFGAFINIGGEIVKILDVQRRHINYIRNLKICEIDSEPKCKPVDRYTTYASIFKSLPPECFNVQILLDAMLEEFNICSSNPFKEILTISDIQNELSETKKYHFGIKSYVIDVLNQNVDSNGFFKGPVEGEVLKMYPSIARKPFLVDPNNDNFITVNPYQSIRAEYLRRNQHLLEKSKSTLLWKKYLLPEEMKVLTNKYHLKTLSEDLDIQLQELQYIVHVLLFLSIKCFKKKLLKSKTSLESLFPTLQDAAPNITAYTAHFSSEATPIGVDSYDELNKSIPNLAYSDEPNTYESKNMENFKWYEKLSNEVMVQELYKAERLYLCSDYKYSVFDDSLLLRFHNDLDDFGINRNTWTQSLRTSVGIKEFCKYLVHEEAKWLELEEIKYVEEYEEEYRKKVELDRQMKEKVYGKLEFADEEFIQPGSFKAKMLAPPSVVEKVPKSQIKSRSKAQSKSGSKSPSKTDTKSKKTKTKSGSKATNKSSKRGVSSALAALEKLSLPTELPVRDKPSFHCATIPPYSFYAYDVSNKRIQLTGSTIVFYSQDGVKATVDQTRFLREPSSISLNITADGHSLILHKNERSWLEPFTFHFCLSDHTIIAFGKPYKPIKPEEKLTDNIYRTLKDGDSNKRQNLYFITDTENHVLKCFNIPFITKKNLILSEQLLPSFLNDARKKRIPLELIPSRQTLSLDEVMKLENMLGSSLNRKSTLEKSPTLSRSSTKAKRESATARCVLKPSKKVTCQSICKVAEDDEISEVVSIEEGDYEDQSPNRLRKSFIYEEVEVIEKSKPKLLQELQIAMEQHLPVFKICSSKLHRSQYVQRVKSYVEVPIGSVLKRIGVKPCLQQVRRKVNISKVLPIKPLIVRNYPKYEMKLCLPSGLNVESVAGCDNDPFCIRQKYVDKGPQCINIANEESRTYMRNGSLLVKNSDGNYNIFYITGQIIKCDLPNYQENRSRGGSVPAKKLRKVYSLSNLTYLHAYGSDSQKFKKYLQRVVYRLDKHMIGKVKTNSFKSYGKSKSGKIGLSPSTIYLLQTNVAPFTKFSLITSDGKKLKVTKTAVAQEKKFYTSTTKEYRYDELLFDRDDGTRLLFNRESELFVQFPDGTRISSWIRIEEEIDDEENKRRCYNNKCDAEEQVSLGRNGSVSRSSKFEKEENGWVFVILNFKFEHPNYGTVIYDGGTQSAQIILPGNLEINMAKDGEYHLDISKNISATITSSTLIFESQLCSTCLQKCVGVINVEPLYNKIQSAANSDEVEFLQVTDSFNKKFLLNFDGSCYNNVDYIQGRYNSVSCPIHNPSDYQKLFLLRRDLNGCRFWDVAAYRNKIKCAMDDGRTAVKFHENKLFQTFYSTTFTTKEFRPIDQKYLIPYDSPRIELTASKTDHADRLKHSFSKIQVLKKLPELSKVACIYKTLLRYSQEKGDSAFALCKELDAFSTNILIQNAEEQRTYKQKQAEIDLRLALEAAKIPPIPLSERWRKWKQEVNLYLNKIRSKYVPQYRVSKLRKTLMNQRRKARRGSDKPAGVAGKPDASVLIPHICCRKLLEQMGDSSSESTETTALEHGRALLSAIIEADEETDATLKTETSKRSKVSRKTKKEKLFKVPLAVTILNELTSRLADFIKNVFIDEYDICSENKVQYVAEKIYSNILKAAKELQKEETEDFVNIASQILVNNICLENLNPLEMYSLLEHLTTIERTDDICKLMLDSTVADCLEKYKLTKETKMRRKSKIKWYATDSAYELYSRYEKKTYIAESEHVPSTQKHRSLTIVYEAPEVSSESIQKVVMEKNKFLLRSSYTNLLEKQSLTDLCEKCINKNDFFKELELGQDELDESSSTIIQHESESNPLFSESNLLMPHISPESTIFDPSPDDITAIDSRTHLLQKNNFVPPESMRVLFSILSLKDKNIDSAGPYVERNPNLVEEYLSKVTEGSFEKERNESSDIFSLYGECNKCIGKYNYPNEPSQEFGQEEVCEEDFADEEVGQEESQTRVLKRSTLSSLRRSDLSFLETSGDLPEKGKSRVMAKVGDIDIQFLEKGCPPTSDQAVHKCMLQDSVRNSAYQRAIFDNKEYFNGKTVLDVGAGTGILSVFCAQAGAACVYAVEASDMYKLAEEIAEENNFKDVIKVIHSVIEDVRLPEDGKVDIIVSEWMGHFLLHEGMLDSVIWARDKLLRPNGLLFPENVTLYSAPCRLPSLNEEWQNVNGISMTTFSKKLKLKAMHSPVIMDIKPEHLLSDPEILLWLDMREVTLENIRCNKIQHLAVVDKSGRYQGICLWFTCSFPSALLEPVVLSTHPEDPKTHWKQTVIALPTDFSVEKGQPIAYEITITRSEIDKRKYGLEVEMLDPDDIAHPEYCSCFKTKCILTRAVLEKYENNTMTKET